MARKNRVKPVEPKVKLTEADFQPNESAQKLTEEQRVAILNMAYTRALIMRDQGAWSGKEEAAYFNGVSAVFFALKCNDMVPPLWWINARGMLTLFEDMKAEGKTVATKPRAGKTEG